MIPKIIHYCWFGNNPKSKMLEKCIESWRKYLPDYEIIEWNESNFDIEYNKYVLEAYNCKKYAFVSDYARLFALYNYGGIYLDTDVEILSDISKYLTYDLVLGHESSNRIGTALIMSCKYNYIIQDWLESYDKRVFLKNDVMDMTPNVSWLTSRMNEYGFIINNTKQVLNGIILEEKFVFYPYAIGDKKTQFSNSCAVHWCEGSWVSGTTKIRHCTLVFLKKIIGPKMYEKLRLLMIKHK